MSPRSRLGGSLGRPLVRGERRRPGHRDQRATAHQRSCRWPTPERISRAGDFEEWALNDPLCSHRGRFCHVQDLLQTHWSPQEKTCPCGGGLRTPFECANVLHACQAQPKAKWPEILDQQNLHRPRIEIHAVGNVGSRINAIEPRRIGPKRKPKHKIAAKNVCRRDSRCE
jgi:hypothetical protein